MHSLVGLTAFILAALAVQPVHGAPPMEIPFELRAGLLWVKVSMPPSEQALDFLLDSGAGVSVVNLSTARRLGVQLGRRVDVRGVRSRVDGFWPQRMSATASGAELPKQFLAVDLAGLSRACGGDVDGLIGADFFKGRTVQLDFGTKRIRLLSSGPVPHGDAAVKLKLSRGALLASVSVDGERPQWLRVDSGCASALQWVTSARQMAVATGGVAVGLTELNIPATRTTVRLGSCTFGSVPTGLHAQPIFTGESGLLGNGLLTRFERVTFDTRAGWLVLERGSSEF